MSSFRRHCTVNNNDDYIKNGLVFWLDGINKGNNEGYWTDLIQNIKFEPFGNVIFNKDNIYLSDSNSYLLGEKFIDNLRYYVLEVVVKVETTRTVIFSNRDYNNNGISASVCNDVFNPIGAAYQYVSFNHIKNTLYTVSATLSPNANKLYINKQLTTGIKGNSGVAYNDDNIAINKGGLVGFTENGAGIFKLYSIRVYNRELTEQEILYNQEIDNKRFNLGL